MSSPSLKSNPLIQTKLHVPRIGEDVVSRPHLIDKLNQGLNCKLTLVSAPSGFGKTTLVADWMRGINQPVGWYSLDQNDNDLVTFLRYVVTAVQDAHSENDNYEACNATSS